MVKRIFEVPGGRIPKPDLGWWINPEAKRCHTARSEEFSIGAERDGNDPGMVLVENAHKLSLFGVPEAHGLVVTGGGQQTAVGAERNGIHFATVSLKNMELLPQRDVP